MIGIKDIIFFDKNHKEIKFYPSVDCIASAPSFFTEKKYEEGFILLHFQNLDFISVGKDMLLSCFKSLDFKFVIDGDVMLFEKKDYPTYESFLVFLTFLRYLRDYNYLIELKNVFEKFNKDLEIFEILQMAYFATIGMYGADDLHHHVDKFYKITPTSEFVERYNKKVRVVQMFSRAETFDRQLLIACLVNRSFKNITEEQKNNIISLTTNKNA